jgi:hypothetical protein
LAIAAAALAYGATVLWFGRGTSLFVDEVQFFTQDRGLDLQTLVSPVNGHLVLVSRLLSAVSFDLFAASFVPLRIAVAVGGALVAVFFFALVRKRLGDPTALVLTVVLLFLGTAWEVTFTESGITHVYCLAGGLGALLALDSEQRGSELIACVLLIVSVSAFTLGLAFAAGAGALIVARRDPLSRLWLAVVPVALYVAWIVWVKLDDPVAGGSSEIELYKFLLIPNFAVDQAAALAGALPGLNYDFSPDSTFAAYRTDSAFGALIAIAAAAAIALGIRRRGMTPMLWGSLVVLAAMWVALALGVRPGRTPETARYVYATGAVVVLIASEAWRGARLARVGVIVFTLIVAVALLGNLARLRQGYYTYRDFALELRAQLTALDLARGHVADDFHPPVGSADFAGIVAGDYYAAVDRIGTPAFDEEELVAQSEALRATADSELIAALGIGLTPLPPGSKARACEPLVGERTVGQAPLALQSESAATVALSRYASGTLSKVGKLKPGVPGMLDIPPDAGTRPWRVSALGPSGVTVCRLELPG